MTQGPILKKLIVTLFMGLSVGANVVAAQDIGAKHTEDFRETVHTFIALSLVLGLAMMLLEMAWTDGLLHLLGTPEDIFPQAKTYLWYIFLGVSGTIVYNFGAAILRAVGDTRRPMIFMLIAGVLNFALNILLVAGLQGSAFSISYLLVQSSINSLGATVMAAVTVAWSIDNFCYVSVNALGQAAASFAGQNYGAKEYGRIRQVYRYSMAMAAGILVVLGVGAYVFGPQLFRIFTDAPAVIAVGKELMFLIGVFGFVNGTMDIPFNVVRGMGRSVFPMVSSLICICVLRVVWVCTIFSWFHTVTALFLCFPVAKGLTSVTGILYYHYVMRQLKTETAQ